MKIIFLDIDGVLNCENGYKKGMCDYKYIDVPNDMRDNYQRFYPPCKKLLNELIAKTGANIVISSTWRKCGLDWMRRVWKEEDMFGEIIDVTPGIYLKTGNEAPRGLEIESWLYDRGFYHCNWSKELQEECMLKSGIENYIIIDDDSDMLYNQRNHFVHVDSSPRNKSGFTRLNYNKAEAILNDDNYILKHIKQLV